MPNLIEVQKSISGSSMRTQRGFYDVSPVRDHTDNLMLDFIDYRIADKQT